MLAIERRWKWAVVVVLLAALGPLWAALELEVVPRTPAGLLVLAASGPSFIALLAATDAGLRWSGRQEVLGSLEFSALRLAIAMGAAVVMITALVLFGNWFAGSSAPALAVRRFLADNFR